MALDTTILDLDSILDGNLAEVPDVPDFVTPPEGTYLLSIANAELDKSEKDGKATVRIVVTVKVDSTLELKNKGDLPVADGSLYSERFNYSEDGLKYFKRYAKNVLNVSSVEDATLREILDTLKGAAPFKAVLTLNVTPGKEEGTTYTNVRTRIVHETPAV